MSFWAGEYCSCFWVVNNALSYFSLYVDDEERALMFSYL